MQGSRELGARPRDTTQTHPNPMHIDPYIVLGSAVVGFLVGMTGAGGGALMTPMLILLFGVTPSTAISSDLVAAVVMRPIGAGVHLRAGTVNLQARRAGWCSARCPTAFLGRLPAAPDGRLEDAPRRTSSSCSAPRCWSAPAAMVLRYALDRRAGNDAHGYRARDRPAPAADRR